MFDVTRWAIVAIAISQCAMCVETVKWHKKLSGYQLKKEFCGQDMTNIE